MKRCQIRLNLVENENWEPVFEEINDGIIVEKRPVNVKPKSMKNEIVQNGFGIRINLFDNKKTDEDDTTNTNTMFYYRS